MTQKKSKKSCNIKIIDYNGNTIKRGGAITRASDAPQHAARLYQYKCFYIVNVCIMSTRSNIELMHQTYDTKEEKRIAILYHHHDGYLEGVGNYIHKAIMNTNPDGDRDYMKVMTYLYSNISQ